MTVEELAVLLGMDPASLTDADRVKLQLYIDGAIEYMTNYFDAFGCACVVDPDNLSSGLKLAIKQYAEITNTAANVTSESVGGLSLSFGSGGTNGNRYAALNDYLSQFCAKKSKVRFIPLKPL